MKRVTFFTLVFLLTGLVATPTLAANPTGWTGAVNTVTRFWVGPYGDGDALVFDTSSGTRFYFNLNGSEATRQMAAALVSAYYKAKKVDLERTGRTMTNNATWYEVDALGVQ